MIQGEFKQPQYDPEAAKKLMIRRTLCSKEVSKEPILRRNIFKTRCKTFVKWFKMIINNGTSTNFSSKELVTKLQL